MIGAEVSECNVDKDNGTLRTGTVGLVKGKWGERKHRWSKTRKRWKRQRGKETE
jgi:hypothetical protein